MFRFSPPSLGKFFQVNGTEFAVLGTILAAWLYNWRRIRRIRGGGALLLVAASWFLSLIDVVILACTLK